MAHTKGVALVTGASNGFGRLTVEALARDGWRVFAGIRDIGGRNATAAAELTKLGIEPLELDVTSDASVDAAAAHVAATAGTLDVLVNNAGTAHMGVTEAFTPASLERQLATNVVGPHRVNRAFLPAMRAKRAGLVVFVSSVVGRIVYPFAGPYVASKFAIEALADSYTYELRPFGIDVAIVQPGAYGTNIFASLIHADDTARVASYGDVAKIFDQIGAGLAQATEGKSPSDVADVVLALANAPAGERAQRTLVGGDPRAEEINQEVAKRNRAVLNDFGLGALLPSEKSAVPA